MAICAFLVFGIPLTDEFGGKLRDVHSAVWDYAFVDHDVEEDDEEEDFSDPKDKYKPGIVSLSTADDHSLVLGVGVPGEDPDTEPGVDLGNTEQVKALHDKYLGVIAALPEDVQQGLKEMGRAPKLCVLRGPW